MYTGSLLTGISPRAAQDRPAKTDALDARRAARQVLAAPGHLYRGLGETAKPCECWRPPAEAPKGPEWRLSVNSKPC